LLYFVPFFIIINYGSSQNVDTFSVYYSLFNSFVAMALGLTTSVKYFGAKNEEGAIQLEAILLCVIISLVASLLYYMSMETRIPIGIHNDYVAYLFLLAIPTVSLFYFIASVNESSLKVASNNQSNSISLLVFIATLVVLEYFLGNILYSVCFGFLITRVIMLLVLFIKSDILSMPARSPNFNLIKKIILHGAPITLLFFAQKYIQTEGLLHISKDGGSVSLFQMILTISLLFNLYSNAVSTNGFIKISKKPGSVNITNYFLYSILMCLWVFVILIFVFEFSNGSLLKSLVSQEVLFNQLIELKYSVYFFIASDMLFVIAIFYSRGVGDNFRVQCLWVISIILGY
ncbi:hypothetical protein L1D34_30650, partial [Vibrio mediterranei]|uniref:hypothetical protein n=1 Tax=Vibrio mediterranei TaxID=689 RepID=UPI001EFDE40E